MTHVLSSRCLNLQQVMNNIFEVDFRHKEAHVHIVYAQSALSLPTPKDNEVFKSSYKVLTKAGSYHQAKSDLQQSKLNLCKHLS